MSNFQYKKRDAAAWKSRQDQSPYSGNSFLTDSVKLYKVKPGDNWLRILPPTWENPTHYGYDVYLHFGIGPDDSTSLCPFKMRTGACPVCEAAQAAERSGDEELARSLRVSKRVLTYVIDRKNERESPFIFNMPWTLDRDISTLAVDPRTGEVFQLDDPTNGYDVSFVKSGEKMLTKYSGIRISQRSSAVDPSFLDLITEFPIPTLLNQYSYGDIEAMLTGAVNPRDDRVDKPSPPAPPPTPRAAAPASRSSRDPAPPADDTKPWEEPDAGPAPARARGTQTGRAGAASAAAPAEESGPPTGVAALRARLAGRR